MSKNSKGFTLIELLVVIAMIGILAAIILAMLSGSKAKSNDAKIISQLGQMTSQGFLFSGTTGTAYVVPTPYNVSNGITGAAPAGTVGSGTLFNATTGSLSSLYALASTLPGGTMIYYGWNGIDPNTTGRWFFAASTSTGAFCNDNKGTKDVFTGTPPTTLANFTAGAAFPNANAAGGYRCD